MTHLSDYGSVYRDVASKGAPVTFTGAGTGAYDPLTDTTAASTDTIIAGMAMQAKGDPMKYQALNLVESESPTLLFVPDTYGAVPKLGYSVVWGGVGFTVQDVSPMAPDGVAILARVIVSR